jgi:hypothetical protein
MNWTDLAQDTKKWRFFLNVVMNFNFHKMRVIFWLALDLLASQEGPRSAEVLRLVISTRFFKYNAMKLNVH